MIIIDALIVAYGMMLLGGLLVLSILILGIYLIVAGLIGMYEENRKNRKNKYTGKRKTKKPVCR